MADSIANRDEAHKCLIIARRALAAGDTAKAERFAAKAMQMHRSDEVEQLLVQIKLVAGAGAGASASQQPSEAEESPSPREAPQQRAHTSRQSQQEHPSTSKAHGAHPNGMGRSNLRHRAHKEEAPLAPDPGAPDQRKQVAEILAAKDLYSILGLSKTATDDDIRKAYRKLALKLHPDKNCAHKADEAFKAVGKAFACLSDPDKRAYYDRTGYESATAAQAAAAASRSTNVQRGPGGMYYTQDFDPDEIFNMFFGGMNPNARVFRAQFGGGGGMPQRRQAPSQQQREQASNGGDDMQRILFNLFQFLPVILLVLISMFAASQKSPFSLIRDPNHYPHSISTQRLDVPYFVKGEIEFERTYPRGSSARFKLERQVESDYYDKMQQRCQTEKMSKHRMWAHGRRDEANRMPMAGCDEVDRMNQKLGLRNQYAWT